VWVLAIALNHSVTSQCSIKMAGWIKLVFGTVASFRVSYTELKGNSGIFKNKGTSLWNFHPNSRLRKFCFGISIVEMCYWLSLTEVDAQSMINWTIIGQLSWQYLRLPVSETSCFYSAVYGRLGQLVTADICMCLLYSALCGLCLFLGLIAVTWLVTSKYGFIFAEEDIVKSYYSRRQWVSCLKMSCLTREDYWLRKFWWSE